MRKCECACGCGKRFERTSVNRIYATKACCSKAVSRKRRAERGIKSSSKRKPHYSERTHNADKPSLDSVRSRLGLFKTQDGANGLSEILGKWPGEETEQELLAELRKLQGRGEQ